MNQATALRSRLLAVAASSRRSVTLPRSEEEMPPCVPATGDPTPVLVLGEWAAPVCWPVSATTIVADHDVHRLEHIAAGLIATGTVSLHRVLCEPNDLRTDLGRLAKQWAARPPRSFEESRAWQQRAVSEARRDPVVPDGSCAVVCCAAVNECGDDDRLRLIIGEVFRVLRRGGVARFAAQLDDEAGRSCSLLTETAFLRALADAGFYGMRIVSRSAWPVSVHDAIETRAYVVDAFRGKEGACLDRHQAVIYRGPWKKVYDDDGHVFERDVRTAVCEKTFRIVTSPPYASDLLPVEPHLEVPLAAAQPFHCRSTVRSPAVTKGLRSENESEPSCC